MSQSLKTIRQPIAQELDDFEVHFKDAMKSNVALLDTITYYIVKRKGKQVRPMFVFLCAKICGDASEAAHVAASLIELLHTASLVHDDVVDDSMERRGFFSINALWKNKISVLVGDYFFAQGMLIALKNKKYRLLELMSEAVKDLSEGELLQLEKARRLDIKEDVYYDIIRRKTASLIAAACAVGAAAATEDESIIQRMHLFGETIGIAFQIKDDLFDYGTDDVGKPLGIDIKEKKMTLPLIYALDNASKKDRKHIINLVKNHNEDKVKVAEVIAFVKASGGMEYAEKAMYEYRTKAFEILHEFPESEVRQSLEDLVVFVTERKK